MNAKDIPTDNTAPDPYSQNILPCEQPTERFVGDIATTGIEEYLKVVHAPEDAEVGFHIIDGKRRWRAAKLLDMDTVPCEVREFDSEQAKKAAILALNDHRDETFTQKMKMALEYEEEVAPFYEERMNAGKPLPDLEEMEAPPSDLTGGTKRAYAADRVGWSTGKLNQAKQIWRAKTGRPKDIDDEEIIDKLQEKGQELVEQLDDEAGDMSVYRAYQEITMMKERLRTGIPVHLNELADEGTNLAVLKLTQEYYGINDEIDGESLDDALATAQQTWESFGGSWSVETALSWVYLMEKDPTVELEDAETTPALPERKPKEEDLHRLYWEENRSLSDVAIRYGVPTQLVKIWMKEEDVPMKFDEFDAESQDDLLENGFVPDGLTVDSDPNVVTDSEVWMET